MKRRLGKFIQCDCVYSRKLKKLVPTFLLSPRNSENEVIVNNNEYVDSFLFKETYEDFNSCDLIIPGIYNIVTKEVFVKETAIITSSWIDESLIGKKVLKPNYAREKNIVKLQTIDELIIPKEKEIRNFNKNEIQIKDISFVEKENLNKFLTDNDKRVLYQFKCEIDIPEELDYIVEIIEPYIFCKLNSGVKEVVSFLSFISEE